jgi:hypothetical protein
MKSRLAPIICLAYCLGTSLVLAITAGPYPAVATNEALVTAADMIRADIPTPATLQTPPVIQHPVSAEITPAPSTLDRVIKRQTQKCFNDQGFQVDCATWTGYYCKDLYISSLAGANQKQTAGARREIPMKVGPVMGNGIPATVAAEAEAALSSISLLRLSLSSTHLLLCWRGLSS